MDYEKEIIAQPQPGGAPIYIDDLAQIQENAKTIGLGALKYNAEKKGFRFSRASGTDILYNTKAGAFITPPVYSNIQTGSSVTTCDVSPFTVLLGEKVCYYPGGSIEVRSLFAATPTAIAVTEGDELKEARVFRNGQTHDVVVSNSVKLTPMTQGTSGWDYNSSIKDKYAVALVPAFHDGNGATPGGSNQTSGFINLYHMNHPNTNWDLLGIGGAVQQAYEPLKKSDLNIGSWVSVGGGGTYSGSQRQGVLVRKESINQLIRFQGEIYIDDLSGSVLKVAQLPTGFLLNRNHKIACVLSQDSTKNISGYLEIRTDGGLYMGADSNADAGAAIAYLDSVCIDY